MSGAWWTLGCGRWFAVDSDELGWWNFVARAIAVDPSRRLRSCCPVLGCNLLVVVWVASGLVVVMEGILIVGSPLAGLAGLPLALRRGCGSRCGEVGCRLR